MSADLGLEVFCGGAQYPTQRPQVFHAFAIDLERCAVIPIIAVFSQVEHWAFLQRILCSFIEGCVEGLEPSEWPDFEEHLTGDQAVIQGTDWGKFFAYTGVDIATLGRSYRRLAPMSAPDVAIRNGVVCYIYVVIGERLVCGGQP